MADTDTRNAAEKAADLAAAKAAEVARTAEAKAEIAARGEDPNELVHIKHDKIHAIGGPVPRYTISTVWAAKGWSETESPQE